MTGAGVYTAFFGRTFEEAMELLIEARNYIVTSELRNQRAMEPADSLNLCCETMRMTARLTNVMAWLLAQKAVHAEEITLAESVAEPFALGNRSICLQE